MGTQNGLFSMAIHAGRNTYFVNVNEAKNGNKYLAITESQADGDARKNTTIRVFGQAIGKLAKAVTDAVATV
jgi:hypothetical protein